MPGLYVIDSIVRQSRHQFGQDKDVYGPRFSKNFEKTFRNLFVCPPNDQVYYTMMILRTLTIFFFFFCSYIQPKVIRVLNLWQKNGVFPPEVIQPILSMAPAPGKYRFTHQCTLKVIFPFALGFMFCLQ